MRFGAQTALPGGPAAKRLVESFGRHAPADGGHQSAWPGLVFARSTRRTEPEPRVYTPSLCIVAQGSKGVTLGHRAVGYEPLHFAVIGAHLAVSAGVREASANRPFLAMSLELDTPAVHELFLELDDAGAIPAAAWEGTPPLHVCPMDEAMADAAVRFVEAIEDPIDRKFLAPAALREVVYRAARSEAGALVRLAARREGRSEGLARALQIVHAKLAEPLDVPGLARAAGMSVSTFHEAFKAATALPPMQYVKRLRLGRARQLMVEEGCLAAEAAFRVGYESPSQFSRDFRALFGLPPRRYAESLRGAASLHPVRSADARRRDAAAR
jgi:AraC-like DNA-binding protein